MSKNPARIQKLEALLSRVQSRASAPRASNGAAVHAVAAPTEEFAEQEEHTQLDAVQVTDIRTAPPPADTASHDAYDDDAEVEVSSEVVEVDIDVDEPIAAESGAQPVSHVTEPPAELEEVVDDEVPVNTRPSGASEELAAAQPANELEEPAPSSSRRPIGDEAAAAAGYEEESSPRHTPPPESGKQVSPSASPPRKSTVPPPPSLEGHTLIGGWREPGLGPQAGAPGIGPGTPGMGVRVPAPPPAAGAPPPVPAAAGSSPQIAPAQASGTRLSPDVTRPDLPQAAKVATIEGASPVAKPATMGDLLDLTLGL